VLVSPLLLAAGGLALMALSFAVVYAIARRISNAGIVDIAWAGSFTLLALLYGLAAGGDPVRRLMIAGMYALWSLRLSLYLYGRVMGHHPVEDGRYQELRREWGAAAERRLFWFFQAQGLLAVMLAMPLLLGCLNPSPAPRPVEWAGLALFALALGGESLADRQLARFKAAPESDGQVCQAGLWRYSRHPNYFFEWLIWCAYWLFALASPWGWATVYCPLLMLYFLFRVTGIPATEAQALRSKGEAYREYQRTTSVFMPWFRRAAPVTRSRA